jgi:hypothetical protein
MLARKSRRFIRAPLSAVGRIRPPAGCGAGRSRPMPKNFRPPIQQIQPA